MAPPRALARALARGLPSRASVAPSRSLSIPLAFAPARGKATQATARIAPPADLPFYASWIGGFLGASLSREQLDAFASAFLPAHHAARPAATATALESTPDDSAALAAARRERDAAASRVSELEADALALRLRLANTDAAALETLRAEAADARAEAADARIARNAARDRADVATAALAAARSDALDEIREATFAEFDATRATPRAIRRRGGRAPRRASRRRGARGGGRRTRARRA